MEPIKPGYKTTEFWLTAAASVISLLMASGAISDGSALSKIIGVAATALTTLGYSLARGLAKK